LTFKVTLDPGTLVTAGAGAAYSPSAVEFTETWTFTPTLSVSPGAYTPPGPLTYRWRGEDAAGGLTDPLADAQAVSGLGDDGFDYSRGTFKNARNFDADGNRISANSEFSLDQGRSAFSATDEGGYHSQGYNRYLFGAQGNYLASSLYDAAMIEFLTGRTLSYRVTGYDTIYGPDFSLVTADSYEIMGSAVLIAYSGVQADPAGPNGRETFGAPAAVPEPATWALMIGGFGLAGATLRRRRSVAAA
ncbi:MAG: PEPxxWA-CTERM sorting domain-containing protein, partial [Pseudomonadota bacterium]